jgi:uroporphyrin-III C-methyltransferase/precorrin-2 dehydrogenase/sirohydrochlorin ferrochelatase
MQELARLPVFFSLQDKRALVTGGSAAAAWKTELLSAAGAQVDVYAMSASEELLAVAADAPRGPVIIHPRAWMPADFAGAVIAVGACENVEDAARFAGVARTARVPVNVIDKPEFCDFAFGAIVNRSPLVIGISTDGAAPVLAQAIRGKLEALIPAGFGRWADAARRWRPAVKTSGLSFAGRRRFWQLFTARAMAQPDAAPEQSGYDVFVAEVLEQDPERGSVTIIQVSTGEADLLTLRAARALQTADVVLFDQRVPDEILDFSRREARRIALTGPNKNVEPTSALILSLAQDGKRVVCVRYGAECFEQDVCACHAAAIQVRAVPGVTAGSNSAFGSHLPLLPNSRRR